MEKGLGIYVQCPGNSIGIGKIMNWKNKHIFQLHLSAYRCIYLFLFQFSDYPLLFLMKRFVRLFNNKIILVLQICDKRCLFRIYTRYLAKVIISLTFHVVKNSKAMSIWLMLSKILFSTRNCQWKNAKGKWSRNILIWWTSTAKARVWRKTRN